MRYKRIRASLRSKREQAAFHSRSHEIDAAAQELVALQQEEAAGRIKLYYGDAAGFALRPALSYAWQRIGARIAVPQTGRAQVNGLGFLRRSGEFIPYLSEGVIDSETVIACLDPLAAQADKPTVVVLDNASVHRSAAVEARRAQWERQGMRLYFLPKYAPELNLIEHLWRAIKYRWLSWSAYQSMAALRQEVEQVLIGIGTKYRITFS
jgi:transposase